MAREDPVQEYCDLLVSAVKEAVGYELDYSVETLPVLDHYITQSREGGDLKEEVRVLVASTAGVYFGEVLKRRFGAVWHIVDPADPFTWDLRFTSCPLALNPVHTAYEILANEDVEGIDGSLRTAPQRFELLEGYFASLGEVTWEEYYSFSGRTEMVMAAVDLLTEVERFMAELRGRQIPRFGRRDPLKLNLEPFDAAKYEEIYGAKAKEAKQALREVLQGIRSSGNDSVDLPLPVVTEPGDGRSDDEDPRGGSDI